MTTEIRSMDPARSRLRATVAEVGRHVSSLENPGGGLPSALGSAWKDLVAQLALGPEPETRTCPRCGGLGMREATLCISCWTKLTPLHAANE